MCIDSIDVGACVLLAVPLLVYKLQFDNQEPGENDEILSCLANVRPGNGYFPYFDDRVVSSA